jgi:Ca2+-binding EF-hand superfamily protein
MATHEASGAVLTSPEEFDGPEEFAQDVFDKNQQDGAISKERFIGLGHCLWELARTEGGMGPDRDIKRMIKDLAGPFADKDKCKEATQEIIEKISAEVIPFAAGEVFDWMDQDKSKGVCKDEIDCAITAAMSGPTAAFGMLFSAIDKDNSGTLSTEEISNFFETLVKLGGRCAKVLIDVFAATFKGDMANGAVSEIFGHIANEEGFVTKDQEEMEEMKQGIGMLKREFGDVDPSDLEVPQKALFDFIKSAIKKCKEAGDLSPDGWFDLFNELIDAEITAFRALLDGGEMPVPPEILEKFRPFIDTASEAFRSGIKEHAREVADAYFSILDTNNDGILSSPELMAVAGIMDTDMSAEDSFDGVFAIVDTDGDGKVSRDEAEEFLKRMFDLAAASAKAGVGVYMSVINAVAKEFIKFFLNALCDGEELTSDKFTEIAGAFAEDGPEVLMAPLMQ